jgi:hypothetical protein
MEQRLAEAEARALAELAQADKDRAGRAADYHPGRALSRVELLEAQGLLVDGSASEMRSSAVSWSR